ncbi:hypothetical protein KY343_03585 [Candidatus Woesearchaeota archaeon]|nr:hypothetical protein [Candidatus Woesearchaeota archaeon]
MEEIQEIEQEIEIDENELKQAQEQMVEIKEGVRKAFGLISIKKKMPNYIRKSMKHKEWMVGDDLGETMSAQ